MRRPALEWIMRQVQRDSRLRGRVPCADGCQCRRPLPMRLYLGEWQCICGQVIDVAADAATEAA